MILQETSVIPTMSIQCDWDDVLRNVNGEVWISCKYKDKPSTHGKLKCISISNGILQISGSEGFIAEALSREAIVIRRLDSYYRMIFIAPTKIYSSIHKKSITALSVSPRGQSVSACQESKLHVWDFNKGELKLSLTGHVGEIYKCKFFPSGVVVLSAGADMMIKIWCAVTGTCPVTLRGHSMAVTDLAIVDRGRNIISVSKDGLAKLWDCGEANCLGDLVKVSSSINCCDLRAVPESFKLGQPTVEISEREIGTENKILLVGCEDGIVHGVSVRSRLVLFTLNVRSAVNAVAFLDSDFFIVGCQSGEIFLYSIHTPSEVTKVWFESNSAVLSLLANKSLGFLSSHADGSVIYQQLNNDDFRIILTGPNCDPVYEVVTDGSFIYTCSRDAVIRRYNLERVIKKVLENNIV